MRKTDKFCLLLGALAVGGALFAPRAARAETITIDLVSLAPSSLNTTVFLQGSGNLTGGTGQIGWDGSLTATGVTNPAPFNGLFDTYCISLLQGIQFNTLYTYNLDPVVSSSTGITSGEFTEIEELYGSHYADTMLSDDNKAAFQLAIWDVIYGSDSTSVTDTSSSFYAVSGFDPSTLSTANTWLSTLSSADVDTNLVALVGTSPTPDAQDQIFLVPGTMVPLPKPVLGGSAMLAALGLMQWKRRRTA